MVDMRVSFVHGQKMNRLERVAKLGIICWVARLDCSSGDVPQGEIFGHDICPIVDKKSLQTRLVAIFSSAISMQKTKKSIAKRFKVTGSGKLVFRKAGKRHMMRNKNTKQLRRMGQDQVLASPKMTRSLKQAMSPGL